MFVSIYYKPSLLNALTMTLFVHIFMNANKLCLNQWRAVGWQGWARMDMLLLIVVDRFYLALFSALEQTHCARM